MGHFKSVVLECLAHNGHWTLLFMYNSVLVIAIDYVVALCNLYSLFACMTCCCLCILVGDSSLSCSCHLQDGLKPSNCVLLPEYVGTKVVIDEKVSDIGMVTAHMSSGSYSWWQFIVAWLGKKWLLQSSLDLGAIDPSIHLFSPVLIPFVKLVVLSVDPRGLLSDSVNIVQFVKLLMNVQWCDLFIVEICAPWLFLTGTLCLQVGLCLPMNACH